MMSEKIDDLKIENNEAMHRFEARVGGQTAFAEYVRFDGGIILPHTEVPAALEGRGIGSRLARTALDYARDQSLAVVPLCPFIASYIGRHKEYLPLVVEEHRARIAEG